MVETEELVASLRSISGIENRDEAERLLADADYDLQLAVYRLHKQQRGLHNVSAVVDSSPALTRTDSSSREQTLVQQHPVEITVVGAQGVSYHRPGSKNDLLTNWIYTLVEYNGSTFRTQPVRRSSRPHWYQKCTHHRSNTDGGASIRVSLLDLGHNIIGSTVCPMGSADALLTLQTVHAELLSTIDLRHDTQAVVGVLELRLRYGPVSVPEDDVDCTMNARKDAVFAAQMAGSARRSDAITFTLPGLAEKLTKLYLANLEKELAQCPGCATKFLMVGGPLGELAAGVGLLSEAAALDYSRHRVRCPECELEFCASCTQAPFHTGEVNCWAAKQAKAARNCRFCSVPLNSSNLLLEQVVGWRRCTRIEDSWCSSRATESEAHRPALVCRQLFADDDQAADQHWAWASKRWTQDSDPAQWLAFDLGEVCCVQKMRFRSTSISFMPKHYTVERSNVSVYGPWEVLYESKDDKKDIPDSRIREYTFEKLDISGDAGFSARWVRVVFHSTFGGSEVRISHLHWFTSLPAIADVCSDDSCQRYAQASCDRLLPCGHSCCGIAGEMDCGPCLRCLAAGTTPLTFEDNLRNDAAMRESELITAVSTFAKLQQQDTSSEQYCPACWTDSLGTAPSITLRCGHIVHAHCVQQQVERGWPGGPIQFNFMECLVCRQDIKHSLIDKDLEPYRKLRKQVQRMAVEVAQAEHGGAEAVQLLADAAGEDVESYASRQSVFKQCFQCKSPFFFGAAHCGGNEAQEEAKEGIICKECEARDAVVETCDRHGTDHLTWKCRYCCSPATYECFNYAHFCDSCHEYPAIKQLMNFDAPMVRGPTPYCRYPGNQYINTKELWEYAPCKGCDDDGRSCPLGIMHARTGVEHCFGCTLCEADRTYAASLVRQLKAIVTVEEYIACRHRADERDYDKVRLELAVNMLRNGGAQARDALLAGKITKRETVLWMRDWGLGSGALARLGFKGKKVSSIANSKTVEQVAHALVCFVQQEAPEIPALGDLLNREQRVSVRLQALWRGYCTRKTTSQLLMRVRAAITVQKVWRGRLIRCILDRAVVTWVIDSSGGYARRVCAIRVFQGTNTVLQAHRASVRIQSRFRGFKTRKIRYLLLSRAAVVLQRHWRGLQMQ